jgi:hypothetical protein
MKVKKCLESRIRGWLPDEPTVPNFKRIISSITSNRKVRFTLIAGLVVAVALGSFLLLIAVGWMLNPIVPTDVKIYRALEENKDSLLSIDGVVGAGIARNSSTNYVIGIDVYLADNVTSVEEIPKELGEFTVYVKAISEIGESQKEVMIIRSEDFP